MELSAEFRKHAAECEEMARSTRDPESRATWSRMADRWQRCADLADGQRAAAHASACRILRHRRSKFTKEAA